MISRTGVTRFKAALLVAVMAGFAVPVMAQQAQLSIESSSAQKAPATPAPPVEAPAGAVGGMGDVNIYPKRIVIDDRARLGSIGLFNRAAAAGEYEISIADMMMSEDGRLTELANVTDEAAIARVHPATPLLRWSPHRVSLAGNEAQTVRVMLNARGETPPGEYRSHFMILSVPSDVDGGLTINDAAGEKKPDGIGVRIVPRFGISIPVIVRIGETTLDVSLSDPKMVAATIGGATSGKAIGMVVHRAGTRSAFGDLTVTNGRVIVAQIKGVGVYTEIASRAVQVPIDPKADPKLVAAGQKLVATYTDDDAAPGKVLARAEFSVP